MRLAAQGTETEDLLETLASKSPAGLYIVQDGRLCYVNSTFQTTTGYGEDELLDRDSLELVVPEDRKRVRENAMKMLKKELTLPYRFRMTHKDGSSRWITESVVSIQYRGRQATLGHITDINKRKQLEEETKQTTEEWRATFDSITDAISIHDKDFRILRANKAFTELFLTSPSQIIGKHCYELHEEGKPRPGCPQEHTLVTEKPTAIEFYDSHLGRFLLESTSPVFNEKGEVVAIVHVTRDVTEQKQQNEWLMRADRLASLGELAAGTAHELNNPLGTIIGLSQLLMEKNLPDYARKDLAFVQSEAKRAAHVTSNLLTFGRKNVPVKHLNQLNNIVEDVLKLRSYCHKQIGVEVERHLDSQLPEIMVDSFQMQQVFINIIMNAESSMVEAHNKGILTIATQKHRDTVSISFADDGPGIPPENLKRIFDPFFTTKEPGKGTGLGLSICHGIVAQHSGQIYAKSEPGKGSTIFIELPINGRDHIGGTS